MMATIDDLAPNPNNPRNINDKAEQGLRTSMERYGDLSGITFNKQSGQLVCGHQRVHQLKSMGGVYRDGAIWIGNDCFTVRVVDWNQQIENEANVAANNPEIQGEWDSSIMSLLDELKANMPDDDFAALRFDALEEQMKAIGMGLSKDGATEIDPNSLGGQDHECPRCGFAF